MRPKRKKMWLRLGGTSVSIVGDNQYQRTQQVVRCPAEDRGQQNKQGHLAGPQTNTRVIIEGAAEGKFSGRGWEFRKCTEIQNH